MKFEDFNLNSQLDCAIKKLGFEDPTSIQELSIPLIMSGKDVMGESATGSGKTLAFGCGVMNKVEPKKGLQALVLAPTRELAEQVKESLVNLSYKKGISAISIYGGVGIDPQIHALKHAEVVVATPGRLLDHMQRRTIDLSNIRILILDEADRMMDMGFIEDVERIMKACPKQKQTLFFSATIPPKVRSLAGRYMDNPEKVGKQKHVDPSKLRQVYYDVPSNLKISLLLHLLKEDSGLAMIFCNTRRNVDFVVTNLKKNGVDAIAIHGGFTQNKRSKTMDKFNNTKTGALVCTDVAARGLHIDNVSHIYNYDLPKDPKDYVHRIGRTARAGEKGKAINLLANQDYGNFTRILGNYRDFKIEKEKRPFLEKVNAVAGQGPSEEDRASGSGPRRNFRGRGGPGRGGRGGPGRGGRGLRRESNNNSGRRGRNFKGKPKKTFSGRNSGPRKRS